MDFDGDYVDSDELEGVLYHSKRSTTTDTDGYAGNPNQKALQALHQQLANKELLIKELDDDIKRLVSRKEKLVHEREQVQRDIRARSISVQRNGVADKGKAVATSINYATQEFNWDGPMKKRMKEVFGIEEFRHCQRGVCNANMDRRDIVCVMPTGGGKSLTYQLPALFSQGCTFVISPLLALMNDQVLHLRELGIESVMLTSEMPQSEVNSIHQRLRNLANGNLMGEKPIKLCYITPERFAKNKIFASVLTALYNARLLGRFVVDEAHCVSEHGHDFREDYKELHRMRQNFPKVPIMALSATCPPKVLQDLLSILRLKPVVDGHEANADGTIYFASPLYRKNLHYKILPKPAAGDAQYQVIVDYILKEHPKDTGIIYCSTQKDTENCAQKVQEMSGGKILTGAYHAKISSSDKLRLHERWRSGKVKVVCATIAFGLGIDKGDVRFVIHHCIPKSVEGYYQESGRAGRDGKDSDCVLYHRAQDFISMCGRASQSKGGIEKFHDMLKFVEEVKECRKIQFANYFSHSAQLSIASWSTAEKDALDLCGHCDNCTRDPESVESRDMTVPAWQLIKVVAAATAMGKKLTLRELATRARGNGKSTLEVKKKTGRGKYSKTTTTEVDLNLEEICDGPVELSQGDTERLIINLLINDYLTESYSHTAYATNVYLIRGTASPLLLHVSKADILRGKITRKINVNFVKPDAKTRKTKAKTTTTTSNANATASSSKPKSNSTKASEKAQSSKLNTNGNEGEDEETEASDLELGYARMGEEGVRLGSSEEEIEDSSGPSGTDDGLPPSAMQPRKRVLNVERSQPPPSPSKAPPSTKGVKRRVIERQVIEFDSSEGDDSDGDDGWVVNHRGKRPPKKIRKVIGGGGGGGVSSATAAKPSSSRMKTRWEDIPEDEIMVLSSD